jgi:hypothetical protein
VPGEVRVGSKKHAVTQIQLQQCGPSLPKGIRGGQRGSEGVRGEPEGGQRGTRRGPEGGHRGAIKHSSSSSHPPPPPN